MADGVIAVDVNFATVIQPICHLAISLFLTLQIVSYLTFFVTAVIDVVILRLL